MSYFEGSLYTKQVLGCRHIQRFLTECWSKPKKRYSFSVYLRPVGDRVETERLKHRSRAFRALNFSIRAISSTILNFEFSIRAISSRKMVEHFDHGKISSDHRAISSIILEKIFEQIRAFFERNQTFFEHNRAKSNVNTNFRQIPQVI